MTPFVTRKNKFSGKSFSNKFILKNFPICSCILQVLEVISNVCYKKNMEHTFDGKSRV